MMLRHHKILPGVGDERGQVRGDQCAGGRVGGHKGADVSQGIDFPGMVLKEDTKAVRAFQPGFEGFQGRHGIAAALAVDRVQDACRHLGIGLGNQSALQAVLHSELMIIFNDPVVDQGNPAEAVRVGVLLGDAAVGGPAGVADAAVGDVPQFGGALPKSRHLAHFFHHPDLGLPVKIGDSRAVIPPVFQACKAV